MALGGLVPLGALASFSLMLERKNTGGGPTSVQHASTLMRRQLKLGLGTPLLRPSRECAAPPGVLQHLYKRMSFSSWWAGMCVTFHENDNTCTNNTGTNSLVFLSSECLCLFVLCSLLLGLAADPLLLYVFASGHDMFHRFLPGVFVWWYGKVWRRVRPRLI